MFENKSNFHVISTDQYDYTVRLFPWGGGTRVMLVVTKNDIGKSPAVFSFDETYEDEQKATDLYFTISGAMVAYDEPLEVIKAIVDWFEVGDANAPKAWETPDGTATTLYGEYQPGRKVRITCQTGTEPTPEWIGFEGVIIDVCVEAFVEYPLTIGPEAAFEDDTIECTGCKLDEIEFID